MLKMNLEDSSNFDSESEEVDTEDNSHSIEEILKLISEHYWKKEYREAEKLLSEAKEKIGEYISSVGVWNEIISEKLYEKFYP